MMRVDCHVHTAASWDCLTTYDQFIADGIAAGLQAAVVCDHNTLAGARVLARRNPPFRIVPGIEINTRDGELLGLFVRELVPPALSTEETIARLHAQGALAVIPHPFVDTALHRLRPAVVARVIGLVDAIEGANGRNSDVVADQAARELAMRHGKPITAGSDGHLAGGLGSAFLEIDDFTDAAGFLAALPAARQVVLHRSTAWRNSMSFGYALVRAGIRSLRGRSVPLERSENDRG